MFSTWTPKAIALIGELPATLADRSVTIRMRRRARGEIIERLQLHRLGDMEDLRSMAARWASDHLEDLRFFDPRSPTASPGTGRGTTGVLSWPSPTSSGTNGPGGRARAPAGSAPRRRTTPPYGITLPGGPPDTLPNPGGPKLGSEEILAHLHRMEERPWPEWRERTPLSARQLAMLLHPFGITPIKWRQEEATQRGYHPSTASPTPFPGISPRCRHKRHRPHSKALTAKLHPPPKRPILSAIAALITPALQAVADVADAKCSWRREEARTMTSASFIENLDPPQAPHAFIAKHLRPCR